MNSSEGKLNPNYKINFSNRKISTSLIFVKGRLGPAQPPGKKLSFVSAWWHNTATSVGNGGQILSTD